MLRWERHKETWSGETRPQADRQTKTARYIDTVFFSRSDEADSFTTTARVPRRARKLRQSTDLSTRCASRGNTTLVQQGCRKSDVFILEMERCNRMIYSEWVGVTRQRTGLQICQLCPSPSCFATDNFVDLLA